MYLVYTNFIKFNPQYAAHILTNLSSLHTNSHPSHSNWPVEKPCRGSGPAGGLGAEAGWSMIRDWVELHRCPDIVKVDTTTNLSARFQSLDVLSNLGTEWVYFVPLLSHFNLHTARHLHRCKHARCALMTAVHYSNQAMLSYITARRQSNVVCINYL